MQDASDFSTSSEQPTNPPQKSGLPPDTFFTVEEVQQQIRRSRASVYRYANTDPDILNLPFDPTKLNPEVRDNADDALKFHPQEVRRFARDILGLNPTISVQPSEETTTHELLRAILRELQTIREHIQANDN